MAIRRRKTKDGYSYQIDYFDPNGKRVRQSFKKKKEAEVEYGKRVSLIAENRYLDVKKEYKTTLKELLELYEKNYNHQASYASVKSACLRNYLDYFGEDSLLGSIRYVDCETYRNHLMKKLTWLGKKRSDATVNREICVIKHFHAKAVEWEMAEENPFKKGKSLLIKVDNQRIRYLEQDEIDRLIEECKPKKHLYRIVVCAINTGMRRGEILGLKWRQIRNGFIYLEKTKTKNKREIPINDDLEKVLKDIRKDEGLTSEYVFTYAKRKFHRIDCAFRSALGRALIDDFKFHDLRHTFASHVIMRGGSLKDVQELLGHRDMRMTLRYAHLSQEHKKNAVNLLNGLTDSTTSNVSLYVTSGDSEKIQKSI
ncbi:tyrosine-type recombinase/integrase [Thermodesulfobacteriota bacterium]